MEAINHGLTILSWFENNSEHDMPAENIWDDDQALELHWKMVRARREDGSVPDNSSDEGDGDMLGNDLANMFKE